MQTISSHPSCRRFAAVGPSAWRWRHGAEGDPRRGGRPAPTRALGRGVRVSIALALIAIPLGSSGCGDFPAEPSQPALAIAGISPESGPEGGGTVVLIWGTGFQNGATVTFGRTAATDVVLVSSTGITAIAPAHAEGVVDVAVENVDGQRSVLTGSYTYQRPADPIDCSVACCGCWDY